MDIALREQLDLRRPGAAAPEYRRAASAIEVRAAFLTADQAAAWVDDWRELAKTALEPNLFYGPELALAGMRHLPECASGGLLLAWRGHPGGGRLVGVLPVQLAQGRHANPFPILRAAELYGTLSTPLVDPDRPEETLASMLAASGQVGARAILFPYLHADGPVSSALTDVARRGRLRSVRLAGHERAMLRSSSSGAEYVRTVLETRRRKEAARQRRRLAELGDLSFRVASGPLDVPAALDRFLALEGEGWKGTTGTDLASAPGAAAFAREMAASLSIASRLRVAEMTLDDRVIASGLLGMAGSRAFYMKTTYDESLARFSPGLLLTLDLTEHLLDDPLVRDADSLAVAGHPMIDRIWTERFPIEQRLVATGGGGRIAVLGAVVAERAREQVRVRSQRLRSTLSLLRGRNRNQDAAGPPAAER